MSLLRGQSLVPLVTHLVLERPVLLGVLRVGIVDRFRSARQRLPFSDKLALWPCSLPADDAKSYCYAGFEHPQLDSPDGRHVVITYSTNTTDFGSMVTHPNLYWPRLVTVDLVLVRAGL